MSETLKARLRAIERTIRAPQVRTGFTLEQVVNAAHDRRNGGPGELGPPVVLKPGQRCVLKLIHDTACRKPTHEDCYGDG